MTNEEIIELAKQCGHWSGQTVEMNDVGVLRFAEMIATKEREGCAAVCEGRKREGLNMDGCAATIRARGNK